MSIEAKNVTKRFGDFVALDDVSVSIATGSLTALLGPSGGGKSTLDAQVRKEVRKELRTSLRRLHDEVHVTTVIVTHDQEEAMDVADEIMVLVDARVGQVGTPHELYDHPANEFVMSFLGPVTTVAGRQVRPHDLELSDQPLEGGVQATVERVVRLGFEVRADLLIDGEPAWAQLTRGTVEQFSVVPGAQVWVKPIGVA